MGLEVVTEQPERSRLDEWRRRERLSYVQLGKRIGARSPSTARRYCLPPEHPEHRIPEPASMVRIYVESQGFVRPDHFYDLPPLAGIEACA